MAACLDRTGDVPARALHEDSCEVPFGALLHAVRTGCTGRWRVARLETVGTAAFQNGARRRVRQGSVSAPERYVRGEVLTLPVRPRVTLGAGAATSILNGEMPCTSHD